MICDISTQVPGSPCSQLLAAVAGAPARPATLRARAACAGGGDLEGNTRGAEGDEDLQFYCLMEEYVYTVYDYNLDICRLYTYIYNLRID